MRSPKTSDAATVTTIGDETQLALAAAIPAIHSCPAASYDAHFYAPGRAKTVAPTFDDDQASEIDWMSAELRTVAGAVPCVFRPPYGDHGAVTF